ncbi:hypothetical protein DPMN_013982 [Dreissena polymorpha]|uniref:B box-type domain-containing protein n=1 Tax=Dreissena polymorpha TaxID=45954 RepID=A0A9D4N8W6_DREPO|nr:hypothetical protein DPMN_013982 [Dreissena polymorpha]
MASFSMPAVDVASDEVKDHCCSACVEQSIEICADFYCETCLKLYCRQCIHHHGQLFKKHTPYGRNQMNKWPVSKKVKDFLLMCEVHKGETLKMFCDDHSQLCCTDCAFVNHRQCLKVEHIFKKNTNITELQQLSTKLETILHKMNSLHAKQEATIQSVQGSYDEQLQLGNTQENQ